MVEFSTQSSAPDLQSQTFQESFPDVWFQDDFYLAKNSRAFTEVLTQVTAAELESIRRELSKISFNEKPYVVFIARH